VTRDHWLRFLFNRLLFPTEAAGASEEAAVEDGGNDDVVVAAVEDGGNDDVVVVGQPLCSKRRLQGAGNERDRRIARASGASAFLCFLHREVFDFR